MFDQSCAAPGEDGDVTVILGYAGGINHRLEVNFSLASIKKNSGMLLFASWVNKQGSIN